MNPPLGYPGVGRQDHQYTRNHEEDRFGSAPAGESHEERAQAEQAGLTGRQEVLKEHGADSEEERVRG
jgi:hypothetical protein